MTTTTKPVTKKQQSFAELYAEIRAQSRKILPLETKTPTVSLQEIYDNATIPASVKPYVKELIRTGAEGVFPVQWSGWFADRWVTANGINRPRNWPHGSEIGGSMQRGYEPALTDFCLSRKGHALNGGHSGAARLIAAVPAIFWKLLGWHVEPVPVLDAEGYAVPGPDGEPMFTVESVLPPIHYRTGDDPTGKYPIEVVPTQTDDELAAMSREELVKCLDAYLQEGIAPEKNWVSLKANCDESLIRRYDTTTRPRSGAEQLSMYAPSRSWCLNSPLFSGNFNLLAACLRQIRLCFDKEPESDANGNYTYGTPSGGGNTSPEIFPSLFDLYLPILEANTGQKGANWRWAESESGSLLGHFILDERFEKLGKFAKDMVVASCRLSQTEAKKLGQILRSDAENPALDWLVFLVTQHEKGKGKGPDATLVQACLIAATRGIKPEIVAKDSKKPQVPHQPVARGKGWDVRELNDAGEEYVETLRGSINAVNDWFDRNANIGEVRADAPEATDKTRRKAKGRKPRASKKAAE